MLKCDTRQTNIWTDRHEGGNSGLDRLSPLPLFYLNYKKILAKKSEIVLSSSITDSLSAAQLIFSGIKYGMESNLCELSLIVLEEDL